MTSAARHPDRARRRVVVLVSGSGTLLEALLSATADPAHPVEVVAVGADRACRGLELAAAAGLPTFCRAPSGSASRPEWDGVLAAEIAAHTPDLVVCAGFLRLLGPAVLGAGPPVLNTHPSLLPAFPGARAVADALAHGVKVTGATVHLVDAGLDTGPILAQRAVEVRGDDTVDSLHERIKIVERLLLVDVVSAVADHGIRLDGRKAQIS